MDDAGILIDRKSGHSGIFDADNDYLVIVQVRADSIVQQANRQLQAVGGNGRKIRWEISTEDGASGIRKLFEGTPGLEDIQVICVPQKVVK